MLDSKSRLTRPLFAAFVSLSFGATATLHCSGTPAGFGGTSPTGMTSETATVAPPFGTDLPPLGTTDAGPQPNNAPAEVFAHSANQLYRLDPASKSIAVVGNFRSCSGQVIDLAVNAKAEIFVTTSSGLYRVNKTNAQCTLIAEGDYPNSLSFVPEGVLGANEILVGYEGADYVTIDTSNGRKLTLKKNALPKGLLSSGDIVSVKDGPSYLTVTGDGCDSDCLLQVDPKTGGSLKNLGELGYSGVYGIAFWGGSVYGFSQAGKLFEVLPKAPGLDVKEIPFGSAPTNLSFNGAGSTTIAPVTIN
jgi:hypothetical protein